MHTTHTNTNISPHSQIDSHRHSNTQSTHCILEELLRNKVVRVVCCPSLELTTLQQDTSLALTQDTTPDTSLALRQDTTSDTSLALSQDTTLDTSLALDTTPDTSLALTQHTTPDTSLVLRHLTTDLSLALRADTHTHTHTHTCKPRVFKRLHQALY